VQPISKDTAFTENQVFERINFKDGWAEGESENCRFVQCAFQEVHLSRSRFRDCRFEGCDLSLVKLNDTVLSDIKFVQSKLLGVRFDQCNDFSLSLDFENCLLSLSVFHKLKLMKTRFKDCNLQEADFTQAELSGSVFENCDLQRTIFNNTNLEKVDFRSAFNYSINPEINRIKRARFSLAGVAGLLDKYQIEIE
jgi:fluoroquinolone resistance protein